MCVIALWQLRGIALASHTLNADIGCKALFFSFDHCVRMNENSSTIPPPSNHYAGVDGTAWMIIIPNTGGELHVHDEFRDCRDHVQKTPFQLSSSILFKFV